MIEININEAKTHFSHYIKKVEKGETVILCRHNRRIAEIRLIPKPLEPRKLGWAKGKIKIPDSFFEPLPDDILDAFEGKSQ